MGASCFFIDLLKGAPIMRKDNAKQCKRQNNKILRQANFLKKANFLELITHRYIAKKENAKLTNPTAPLVRCQKF